ncbi:PAS domain-containing sensor histidine kinase [Microvirga subterranea]|uniref:histidine kinase n=1 Tax=Microvirga subterranea TaxID=186651 RepID=A0A370HJ08_9HYPH|nr:PAS domain-containing protein [Microvirga subterranea]RDI58576.1 PAS domain S-box-containing protein [Microvirga subterranea]
MPSHDQTGPSGPPIDFKALFDSSPNPYVLLLPDFTIVGMNEAYLRVTMRTREDITGRNMFEAFPGEGASVEQLRASLERALRSGTPDHLALIHYDIPRSDGNGFEERFWSATHTPLLNAAGEVAYILQHTVDVTELHRLRMAARATYAPSGLEAQVEGDVFRRAQAVQEANRSLDAERRHLRRLFEQAPGFMAVLGGPEHRFELANATYSQLIGNRDVLGKPVREALPDVAGQGFFELLDNVYASGQPFVGRALRVSLRQGPDAAPEEHYVDLVYQPIIGADGSVTGIFVQGHDITERILAEQALQESERKFRILADAMPQMVWAARPDGYHDYYNARWYEFTGMRAGSTDGAEWNGMFHPDDQERAWKLWRHCLATGEPYQIEYRLRHRSGQYRWTLGRALPIRNEAGEIERWFGTCTDISEIKEVEADLQAANDEIQRFAYIVSHDLRAPLVNIMGFTSELEATRATIERYHKAIVERVPELATPEARVAVEEDLPEALSFIRTSTAKMDRLIGAILKLSREGRRVLTPEPVDMADLLAGCHRSLSQQLDGTGTEFIVEEAPDVVSDRVALEQIFGNLIDNAAKYLDPARPGRIVVRGQDAGVYVRYEIEDNGRGIDPKDYDRIFDLFRRAGAQDRPGEGIGLAHVRSLVRRLGGAISVSSRPGVGSTFTVLLPRTLHTASEAA